MISQQGSNGLDRPHRAFAWKPGQANKPENKSVREEKSRKGGGEERRKDRRATGEEEGGGG